MTPNQSPAVSMELRASIHRIAEVRRSALEDLAAMAPHKAGSDWQRDRLQDVSWTGRWIAHQAARLGISPDELLGLAGIGPDAN